MNERELIIKNGIQPVAKISDEDLEFIINREFPNQTGEIKTKLEKINSDTKQGKNRISASILKLADKDLNKIDVLIRKAIEDFRDIVSEAEYPITSRYEWADRNEEQKRIDYLKDWEEFISWKDKGK